MSTAALPALLRFLASDRATGRLIVSGDRPGWIDVEDGAVVSTERSGGDTLLVRLAREGLFGHAEWTGALAGRGGHSGGRWSLLVNGDADRLATLRGRLAATVVDDITWFLGAAWPKVTFHPGVRHPFGALHRWDVGALLDNRRVADAIETCPPLAGRALDPDRRREFAEMLLEASPLVRDFEGELKRGAQAVATRSAYAGLART